MHITFRSLTQWGLLTTTLTLNNKIMSNEKMLNKKQNGNFAKPMLGAVKLANMWLETSNEVYAVIFAKHRKQLKPHASFTDSEGDGYHWSSGKPEIMTEWGFENAETPLLKIVQTKQNKEQKDWDVEFFIYCA